MIETQDVPLTEAVGAAPWLRRPAEGLADQETVFVASGAGRARGVRRWISRSVSERFQAITGIGLSHPGDPRPAPERRHLAGRGGLPDLSFLAAGVPGARRVVFIHGTPGEAMDWTPFLRNVPPGQERIAVDRPGFGASGPGGPVVSLGEQAGAVAALLRRDERPAVVVGSSYGGPVALTLAANHPESVAGVLLVGAAADPERERTHPVQHLAATGAVRRLLPRALAHSNAELLALRRELEGLGQRIGRIAAPVTVLQGLHDTLVPMENAAYIARRLTGSARRRVILVDQAGHFLHILFAHLVERALADLLDEAGRGGAEDATAGT